MKKDIEKLKKTASKIGATVVEHGNMVFLNFAMKIGSYQIAIEWGKDNGLLPSTKEDIESVKNDNLPEIFENTCGYVIETTGNTFNGDANACYVWFDDSVRVSSLSWQSIFGDDDDWFAFRKFSEIGNSALLETRTFALPDELVINGIVYSRKS
jgi:hypothetical protein